MPCNVTMFPGPLKYKKIKLLGLETYRKCIFVIALITSFELIVIFVNKNDNVQ